MAFVGVRAPGGATLLDPLHQSEARETDRDRA